MLMAALLTKMLTEIALMALLGRWLLGLLVGVSRERNVFWRLLDLTVAPLLKGFARLSGGRLRPAGQALWAAALLMLLWLTATAAKIHFCLVLGPDACR